MVDVQLGTRDEMLAALTEGGGQHRHRGTGGSNRRCR
jgi:hypothetical protein